MNLKKNKRQLVWGLNLLASTMYGSFTHAQSISFQDAERQLLQNSYSSQAYQSLEQASKLEAEAVKGVGLPRVDLNVRAYAFHNELDLPLGALKNNLEQSLTDGVNNRIDELNLGDLADPLKNSLRQPIQNGVGLIPDSANVVLDDQVTVQLDTVLAQHPRDHEDDGDPGPTGWPTRSRSYPMKSRHVLVASALALALSACGQSSAPPAEPPVATPPAETTPAPAEAASVAPAPATTGSKPATVADCATTIEGNDAMQFNADAITVPASCAEFTINLKHVGTMPVNAMGHNVVVAAAPEYVKADDARIIAHTRMIGGGESAAVTFDVAKLKEGGPFKFFCSFPGHLSLMQGSLQVQ